MKVPFIVALLAACALPPCRADWPQWRGPARDGNASGFSAPAKWPEKLERRWKVDVGAGHASPLIQGDSAYVFTREGDDEVARKLDLKSGKEVWRDHYPAPYEMNPAARAHGKGPKATPLLAGGRLYTFGISGILSAYDASSGKALWRKEFKEFPKTSPDFGAAASPVADGALLYVQVGGKDAGAVLALDSRTGEKRWEWKGDGPAYVSPLICTLAGTKQVVTQTQRRIVALDAASGRLLWSLTFTTPFEQNIISPILSGSTLIFGGLQQATFSIRPDKSESEWNPARVWEMRDANFYMSTPVLAGGKLYGLSFKGRGTPVSIDAATGRLLWSGEGRVGDNASLVLAGGLVLMLPVDGILRVLRPDGDALAPVAQYTVSESATWATPAYDGNHILVKDQTSLTLWDVPASAGASSAR